MGSLLIWADGRRVDLRSAIDQETYAELEATQGLGTRKNPLMFCGNCNDGIHIKHCPSDRNRLFGAHFTAGDCADLTIRKSVMTDEHKRMAEYHAAAARAQGLNADFEVTTTGRTRVDVVIDGRIGVEVQWSDLTAGAAIRRTARSMKAGLEAVGWCAGLYAKQAWAGNVPGYQWLDNGQVLREMPPPRSVRSRGLLTFRADRSWRGGWEPVPEPLTALVDEAVVRMAAGSIKPVMVGGVVQLVRADGIKLYEELTGLWLTPYTAGLVSARSLSSSPEVRCERPAVRAAGGAEPESGLCREPGCGEPGRPYENGALWLCVPHTWGHYKLGRKARQLPR